VGKEKNQSEEGRRRKGNLSIKLWKMRKRKTFSSP